MADQNVRKDRGNVMILGQKRRLVQINIRFLEPENTVPMGDQSVRKHAGEVKILGQKRRLVQINVRLLEP